MATYNWIADRLLAKIQSQRPNLGELRRIRGIDINNYERKLNDFAARVSSDKSQRLAIVKSLGLPTAGLIVGGQRDEGPKTRQAILQKGLSPTQQTLVERQFIGTGGKIKKGTILTKAQRYGQLDPD